MLVVGGSVVCSIFKVKFLSLPSREDFLQKVKEDKELGG